LFPFTEINKDGEIFLESEMIEFISYPYEWGFEQMKAAALFHLDFIAACLSKNCFPKDASPYNIQFVNGKPVFIDILSLAPYIENVPWNAYRQFCEQFLAPLLLSSYFPGNWNHQLMIHLEGIPLKKVSSLLPFKACFNSLSLFHVIAHAEAGNKNTEQGTKKIELPKKKILSIIKHLRIGISELSPKEKSSQWTGYTNNLPYTKEELNAKKQIIKNWAGDQAYKMILDVGANNDMVADLVAGQSKQVILIDTDRMVIDQLFKQNKKTNVLPLNIDITQVSPAIGLQLSERKTFFDRIKPDLTFALAVIHHLFHSRNIPLDKIAELFKQCSSQLIIEFVTETDEMFLKIQNVNNAHPYNKALFEKEFEKYFKTIKIEEIKAGKRFLYYMEKK